MNAIQNMLPELEVLDGLQTAWVIAYEESLKRHIDAVQKAGLLLQVPVVQLEIHDRSKYSLDEFPYYVRQFHGDKGDPSGFAVAWLHHQNTNPHHWEYWITRSDHTNSAADGCLPMPERYVREMVADWMGASYTYTGSWDITDWCRAKIPAMKLHPTTLDLVTAVLREAQETAR
jgi:hypothetical protein